MKFHLLSLVSIGSFVASQLPVLSAEVYTAQGSLAGEITSERVLLQTRLTAIAGPELASDGDVPGSLGTVAFDYGERADFADAKRTYWEIVRPERDFIAKAQITGLKPGTRYHYRPVFGVDEASAKPGATGSFKTLPGAGSAAEVNFVMGSCMNYNKFMHGDEGKASGPITATEEDKRLGFPAFAAMAELKPDFFVGTGDIVYYDNILNGPAQTLPELRRCWHEQFRFPRMVRFFAATPSYWSKDDHDFRFNDSDNESVKLPLPGTGIELFREQMPILGLGETKKPTYRTHRVSADLQLWFSEGRDYRSPNRMQDGPDKTLWGAEQKAWLMSTLKESDAKWKILITPTPMVGPDDAKKKDNHVNLGGFRHEADTFFAWIKSEGITNFFTFCGDRHWQYHSIHPSGVEEFACGALNDENSRVGVAPGSKMGTDPNALIQQPYTYPKPTGGFIHVRSVDGGLTVRFLDDRGVVLHEVNKPAK
jgi:alkaline phosphatase/alkaline phosphatase D